MPLNTPASTTPARNSSPKRAAPNGCAVPELATETEARGRQTRHVAPFTLRRNAGLQKAPRARLRHARRRNDTRPVEPLRPLPRHRSDARVRPLPKLRTHRTENVPPNTARRNAQHPADAPYALRLPPKRKTASHRAARTADSSPKCSACRSSYPRSPRQPKPAQYARAQVGPGSILAFRVLLHTRIRSPATGGLDRKQARSSPGLPALQGFPPRRDGPAFTAPPLMGFRLQVRRPLGRPSRVSLHGEMGSSPKRLPALMGFAAS
jgi:hypothetical protein